MKLSILVCVVLASFSVNAKDVKEQNICSQIKGSLLFTKNYLKARYGLASDTKFYIEGNLVCVAK